MRVRPSFRAVKRFKKIDESDGTIVYRDFLIPSPTTALTEAVVLQALATAAPFAKPSTVYSYRWPKEQDYPANFQYYATGYRKRNFEIEKRLRDRKNCIAIVSDITAFYSSISQDLLRSRFQSALNASSLSDDLQLTAAHLVEHLSLENTGGIGIATGPEISHIAADLILSRVDDALTNQFQSDYFRYVDDIILIVDRNKATDAQQQLSDLLEAEGLKAHREKQDLLSGEEWLRHGPHNQQYVRETSFEALLFQIKTFLLLHPERQPLLQAAMDEEGISIPLDRLSAIGKSGIFVERFWRLWKRGWWVAMRAYTFEEKNIAAKAVEVRKAVKEELEKILARDPPSGSTRRRWYSQRLRYLVNRSFYLFGDDYLRVLAGPLSRFPEFAETTAMLTLLLDGEATALLNMPGPAVIAASERLRNQHRVVNKLDTSTLKNPATIESLAVLGIFGVGSASAEYIEALEANEREYLEFCVGKAPESRRRSDFQYIDEIRTLQIQRTAEDSLTMIEKRFADEEASVLDALDLGGDQSS